MDVHPGLFHLVLIGLIVVASLVILYWITYTRRLKTPRNVGKAEGIAIAWRRRQPPNQTF